MEIYHIPQNLVKLLFMEKNGWSFLKIFFKVPHTYLRATHYAQAGWIAGAFEPRYLDFIRIALFRLRRNGKPRLSTI